MLVAVTSFVLHGGALASHHAHGSAMGCAAGDHSDHDDHRHQHAHAGAADATGGDPADAAGSPCCTGLCALVLAAVALHAASAPVVPGRVGEGVSRLGAGIDPGGLRRPPRSTDIAA
jgi:hypothetical protein